MTPFERSLRAIRRSISDLAANRGGLEPIRRATDRAYRLARFEAVPEVANDFVVQARRDLIQAARDGQAVRSAEREAASRALKDQVREDVNYGPTAWMRPRVDR
jgi:hypothetical protein